MMFQDILTILMFLLHNICQWFLQRFSWCESSCFKTSFCQEYNSCKRSAHRFQDILTKFENENINLGNLKSCLVRLSSGGGSGHVSNVFEHLLIYYLSISSYIQGNLKPWGSWDNSYKNYGSVFASTAHLRKWLVRCLKWILNSYNQEKRNYVLKKEKTKRFVQC